MTDTKIASVACALALLTQPAFSQSSFELSGQLDVGARYYVDDGLYAGQSGSGTFGFLGFSLEGGFDLGNGEVAFAFSGLAEDSNGRSYFNIGRLYYRQVFDAWDVLVGFNTENWGVTESQSLLNVMNPRANSDPIAGSSLLGTPMVNVNMYTSFGTFSLYALTGFVEPVYGGTDARLRAPIIPDYNSPVFEEGDDRHLDVALRYSHNFSLGGGAMDVSASYFSGTDRSAVCSATGTGASSCYDAVVTALGAPPGAPAPGASADQFWAWMEANATDALVAGASATPVPGLRAYYQEIEQAGISAVYTYEDLQLRLEAINRHVASDDYFAAIVGGDYTWNNVAGGPGSLSVALEYLYDDRSSAQGIPIFEDDIFLGMQYLFNNQLDSAINFSMFHDRSSSAKLYKLGVSSRINDRVGIEMNASSVDTDGWNDPLAFIGKDDFFELKLSTYF
jgi:hypothetical protein